jgi:AraC family transcriptional regulator
VTSDPEFVQENKGVSLAAASFTAEKGLPSKRFASSSDLGWQSILVRDLVYSDEIEGFTTTPTPDLLVAVNIGGPFIIESQRPGGWSKARPQPNSIGATAPGRSSTLRWHSESSEPLRSLHMYLSASLLQETAEGLGSPGLVSLLPDALQLEDPVVVAVGRALQDAVETRADALHADSLAQSLAMHMVYGRLLGSGRIRSTPIPGALTVAALGRVVDYMHANLAERVLLEDLATVASISKFHFVRMFKLATGEPPHRYLIRLRMQRAAELLRRSEDTVQQISAACGYASPGQFASAFRRHYGASPTQYRSEARR